MKKIALVCMVLLTACSQFSINEATAKTKAGELLELLKNHQYEKTKEYYSDALNESEPVEARTRKFAQIESASGPMVSYELLESSKQQLDERSAIALKYKVKCQNTTLTESLLVTLEEGKYKVVRHDITNQ
jgi:hypothetical protein